MLFILTKTYKMLDTQYLSNISNNTNLVIKELFSLNALEILLEYFICSFLIYFMLKDKEIQIVKNKSYKKQLFLEQLITLIISIGLAFIAFLMVKTTLMYLKRDLYVEYKYIKSLCIFIFLHFNLCLLSSYVAYFFNMIIKDRITAIILPAIFIQIPFILFGLTTIFARGVLFPLRKIGEFINMIFLDKLILGTLTGSRFELLAFSKQYMIIILLLLLSISFILMSYKTFIKLDKSNLEKKYYFKASKIFCHLNLSIIFSYLTSIMLSFTMMFLDSSKGIDFASFIFSLFYLTLIPVYYMIQYFVYKKFSDIIIEL